MDGGHCPRLAGQTSTPARFDRPILVLCELARIELQSEDNNEVWKVHSKIRQLVQTSWGPSLVLWAKTSRSFGQILG